VSPRVSRECAQVAQMMSSKPCWYTTCAKGSSEGFPPIGRMVAIVMVVLRAERDHFMHVPEGSEKRRE
jgi:hypothetical protein